VGAESEREGNWDAEALAHSCADVGEGTLKEEPLGVALIGELELRLGNGVAHGITEKVGLLDTTLVMLGEPLANGDSVDELDKKLLGESVRGPEAAGVGEVERVEEVENDTTLGLGLPLSKDD
jgi:hypothetical protein